MKIRVYESQDFIKLPLESQCLYFHLSERANEPQGFLKNYEKVIQDIGIDETFLDSLVKNQFVIPGKDGIVIVRQLYLV